jgi:hypothetical protein
MEPRKIYSEESQGRQDGAAITTAGDPSQGRHDGAAITTAGDPSQGRHEGAAFTPETLIAAANCTPRANTKTSFLVIVDSSLNVK